VDVLRINESKERQSGSLHFTGKMENLSKSRTVETMVSGSEEMDSFDY
jgi:hypothetical protein